MGYYLYITRKASMWDNGPEIGLDEWLDYVDTQPDMKREASYAGGPERLGLATLEMVVETGSEEQAVWFDWDEGSIEVKNPNELILQQMWAIAQSLSAVLRGESDETYAADGEVLTAPIIIGKDQRASIKTIWWRFWERQ